MPSQAVRSLSASGMKGSQSIWAFEPPAGGLFPNALIGHNVDREPLQLAPVPANGPGEMWIVQYPDVAHEAQAIAAFVDDQINKHGRRPGEVLVLAQRRTIGNPIHAALKDRGIPSKSYYQETELDREVAQERLAIFKLFVNRSDRIALRWLLGTGSGDFRAKSYARLRTVQEREGLRKSADTTGKRW